MKRLIVLGLSLGLAACGSVDDKNNGEANNGDANNGGTGNNSNNGVVANNGAPDGDCFLRVDLAGGVAESLDWGLSQGCGGGSGADETVVTVGFGGITTDLNVKITLTDATKGVPANGIAAEVNVRLVETEEQWLATGCTVDLTANEVVSTNEVGDSVLLTGTGSCPEAAMPVDPNTGDPVEVGDFEFSSTALW